MRLDLFLKVSRLCPRRTLAQELCDAGFVLLNDRPAKSAHAVKAGDEIKIRRRDREMVARVLKDPPSRNVSKRDADQLVKVVSETRIDPLRRIDQQGLLDKFARLGPVLERDILFHGITARQYLISYESRQATYTTAFLRFVAKEHVHLITLAALEATNST